MGLKWLKFDGEGLIVWRGVEGVSTPPDDAIEVDQGIWDQTLDQSEGIWKLNADGSITLHPFPLPTTAELSAAALAQRDRLLQVATIRINPLQDAVDLDDATTEEVALLKKWKQYRVALNRIEQQATFPSTIEWPVTPA